MPLQEHNEEHDVVKTWLCEFVSDDGLRLLDLSPGRRADFDIVFAAVSSVGRALGTASEALRADRVIVVRAIQGDGNALQFASSSLQDDADIVLEASRLTGGRALAYASYRLQSDRAFLMEAMAEYSMPDAWLHMALHLQADPEVFSTG